MTRKFKVIFHWEKVYDLGIIDAENRKSAENKAEDMMYEDSIPNGRKRIKEEYIIKEVKGNGKKGIKR